MQEKEEEQQTEQECFDLIVVGGGPAGIMACLEASKHSELRVCLLEKNDRCGKKILISGGGKCNITNIRMGHQYFHGSHPRFAQDMLRFFTQADLLAWLHKLGIETCVEEERGKVWSQAMTSKAVLEPLEAELDRAGVTLELQAEVQEISYSEEQDSFFIRTQGNKHYSCRALILATGGRAAPHLGADDSGLKLAQKLGHKLVSQYPALVGLCTQETWCHELSGLTCEDVGLTLQIPQQKKSFEARGSLLFTHYGLTSPAIFRLSREVGPCFEAGKAARLEVNFLPDTLVSLEDAEEILKQALGSHTKKRAGNVLGWLVGYRRLGDQLVRLSGGDPDKRVRELQQKHRTKLQELLYACPFTVPESLGWKKAETMRGGVDVRKVDPKSMASKLQPGLFICGEMLDIDADVGGYSFQWAFSSGKAAGQAAAHYLFDSK